MRLCSQVQTTAGCPERAAVVEWGLLTTLMATLIPPATAASPLPCSTPLAFQPSWAARVLSAGSGAGDGTSELLAKSTLCLASTLQPERKHCNHVTTSHNMRILCRTGRDSAFTMYSAVVSPALKSHERYSLLHEGAGTAIGRDGYRDSRSTHGVDLAGRAAAAPSVHSSELGPGYRLLYSPVGKPPASFRSFAAAASGGPLAFW